jgi:dihydroorotate dehydrogenase
LKSQQPNCIIGGNIGKNKDTPNESAFQDYLHCFTSLFQFVDYFVVNVSSPNTPGLRELQEKKPLTNLLNKLQLANNQTNSPKPILLKIAPDLTDQQLDDIIEIVQQTKLSGVVATNTTIERAHLTTDQNEVQQIGQGGLSGTPLSSRSTEVIHYLNQRSNGTIPIIGVGGIFSVEDVIEKLEAGASLVQVYTGFIYQGPSMIRKLNKSLALHFAKTS